MEPAGQKYGGTDPTPKRGLTPEINPPKGGGAINGMGEKFAANPVSGDGLHVRADRHLARARGLRSPAFHQLQLRLGERPLRLRVGPVATCHIAQDGQGPAALPGRRRIRHLHPNERAEDLVPALVRVENDWVRDVLPPRTVHGHAYTIHRYRPRVEGLFARMSGPQGPDVGRPDDQLPPSLAGFLCNAACIVRTRSPEKVNGVLNPLLIPR
jgi:hypothetical protein